ncbi:RxLR effector protein [Phytophthora megakarya]|uniref:RxLR effector protein n=1 Tax=Phytophthora megakarya TaxID=4795 RepID=A0A225WUY7_9STRA|nr:RxLR effector protein [Phytophthora megakarya]
MWVDNLVYRGLEKTNQYPTYLFIVARLGETGVRLDDNGPAFIQWLHYVSKYRALKGDEFAFSDVKLLELLEKKMSEAELTKLFVSLTKVPGLENLAQSMIFKWSWSSHRHKLLNEAWLKSKESPANVFEILKLEQRVEVYDVNFLEWMRYTKMYMKETERPFPVANFLLSKTTEQSAAMLFQKLKEIDDLKAFAEKLQIQLFDKWIRQYKLKPTKLEGMIDAPMIRGDPRFAMLEAYTIRFAELHDKTVMEKMKALFANDDFVAALAAAEKV